MKIRTDFVTNSSSSSFVALNGYIIAIRKDITEEDKKLILSKVAENKNNFCF